MNELAGDLRNGWLTWARQRPSPFFDDRPQKEISLLVVHCISLPPGAFGGPYIDRLFLGKLDPEEHPYFRGIAHLRVSAHLLIDREGGVTQYVPFHKRAWHAGVSSFRGRPRCNDFSIGIELEGSETTPYTEAQYRKLARIARLLMGRYPEITPDRIVGHADIAPGRKRDPGESFDWDHFYRLLRSL